MRRFIAYICMAITVLISVGVAFAPVFTTMNPGREFTSGNEIVYRLSDKEDGKNDLENDPDAASVVAKEMRSRLENYKVEDYSVRVEGNDTVRVSLSVNDETKLNHIARYLSFNGGDFSLASAEEETRIGAEKIFVDSEAYIIHEEDIVPYVIFPISDPSLVKTLVDSFGTSDEEQTKAFDPYRANEDSTDEKTTPDIYLWANWSDGDTYEIASKDAAVTGQKIICSFVHSNIWYKTGLAEGEEPNKIQYLCGYADAEGNYDTKKLQEANELATYICNLFNASSFKYEVENLFITQSKDGVTNNNIKTEATAENLLNYGTDINLSWSTTLISTIVATVIVFLLLVLFFRVGALGIAANTIGGVFLTYLIFMALGATFNIAAIIGGVLLAISSLAIGILYMHKLKEEVYKGRSLRKAHQEATKKITLPAIDVAVIFAFAGLMFYFLAGNALKPLGIVLFFGAIVCLVMTLLVFRLLMWLLTNDTSMQTNYKLLNMDETMVPNLMKEEKPTYIAPYENTDLTKKKKPVAIIAGILAVASVALITTFGIIKGSPLNVSSATKESTEIYLSIRHEKPTLSTEQSFKEDVLGNIKVNGVKLTYSDVDLVNRDTYNYETEITTNYTYFVTTINSTFTSDDKFVVVIGSAEIEAESISDAIFLKVSEIEGESSGEYVKSEAKVSYETVNTPNQGYVALACAVSIVGSCIYFAFRYRPSRGVASLIVTSGVTLLTYGLFVMCRIQTTAICSLIMPIAMLMSVLFSMFFFEKEKELLKEQKNSELDMLKRNEIMKRATSLCAAPLFISCIVAAYIAINYFAFGYMSFVTIFAGLLLATVIAALLVTTLLGPISQLISKMFKNIKLPTIKIDRSKKQRIKLQNKPKSSEPEETVFIGIND